MALKIYANGCLRIMVRKYAVKLRYLTKFKAVYQLLISQINEQQT